MNEENKDKIKKFFESQTLKTVIYTLGVLAIVFFIFQAGMLAGYRKASFGRNWGENYERNFGPVHRVQMMGGQMGDFRNLPNANGAIGKIIKIELPNLIVLDDKDQTEKIIIVNDDTEIRRMREVLKKEDLKIDEHIIVVGSPNSSGQIEAKLIRLIPEPLERPF